MIKRDPQEFADFFQCYVAQESDGKWYAYQLCPVLFNSGWYEDTYIEITDLVETPKAHNWKKLYVPQNINAKPWNINAESGENCQKDDLCIHQSEVHTHKEYIIVGGGDNRMSLERTIVNNMTDGWKLLGGVAVDKGLFYQAMVREI